MQARHSIVTSIGYPMALAAICGLALSPIPALADDEGESSAASSEPVVSDRSSNASVASEKLETVYVNADADGNVKKTEVSATLKNPDGEAELADTSNLTDIEADDEDVTYAGTAKDLRWESAKGDDVAYKGLSSKEVPIEVVITYTLDGKKVKAADLAGASGKLNIRFDYKSNATFKTEINGKQETLYVPFTVITAMMLDSECAKNVSATNAKIIDDNDQLIVAGYAMPGLKKSLGKMAEDFDVPEYFEVSADVTNFELKSTLTIATPEMLNDFDTDDLDLDELRDASSELSEAMDAILDASGQLQDGIAKLAKGAKSAKTAAGELADGTDELAKGSKKLAKGLKEVSEQTESIPEGVDGLAEGADGLSTGLSTIETAVTGIDSGLGAIINGQEDAEGNKTPGLADMANQSKQVVQGAQGLVDSLNGLHELLGGSEENVVHAQSAEDIESALELAREAASQAATYADELEALQSIASSFGSHISSASENVTSAQGTLQSIDLSAIDDEETASEIEQQINDADASLDEAAQSLSDAQSDVDQLDTAIGNSDISQLKDALDAFVGTVESADLSLQDDSDPEQVIAQAIAMLEGDSTSGNVGIIGASEQIAQGIAGEDSGLDAAVGALGSVKEATGQLAAEEGVPAVTAGAQQLASALAQLKENMPELVEGLSKLSKGATQLSKGTSKLSNGTEEFADGLGQLADGTSAAAKGAGQFGEGLQQFADEGIGEITDRIDNELLPFADRFDALSAAGRDYTNFSGITKGTKGSVKFVFETESISTDE